jgi:alpha-tubulin suppressor-like RCC1 family protein
MTVLTLLVAASSACLPASLVGWGANSSGQLGPSLPELPAARIDAPWASISAGYYGGSGVRTDGTLWQWGTQMTDTCNSTCSTGAIKARMPSPIQLGDPGVRYTSVSQGTDHLFALQSDGTLQCWGADGAGQCGVTGSGGGGVTAVAGMTPLWWDLEGEPQHDVAHTTWRTASAGNLFSLTIASNGTLWSFGANDHGQLGSGSVGLGHADPQQVGSMTWKAVSAGWTHSLGIASDGTLWGWGDNGTGQLGIAPGTLAQSTTPVQIGADSNWSAVSAGYGYSLALRSDGTLWAWGSNASGRLGDGTTTEHDTPEQIGTATNWASVSAGTAHSMALRTDGTAWAWGDDTFGTLGDGGSASAALYQILPWPCRATGMAAMVTTPQQIGTQSDWTGLSAGGCFSAGIRAQGTQREAWGIDASWSQFGDGNSTDDSTGAVTPVGPLHDWKSLAQGADHSAAIRADGTLWTWGGNEHGQLGDGTTTSRSALTQVGTDTWHSVAAGDGFTVAVRFDGTLWAWGRNDVDQLGDGGATDQVAPEQIGSATNWTSVAAGIDHAVALRSDHTLWAWGDNTFGELGDGTTTNAAAPRQVGTATWTSVSAGEGDTLAVRTDGTLWGWGLDGCGELGDGTTTTTALPVQIGSATTWKSVSAGRLHSVGVRTDGTLWAWGRNADGRLGDGTTTDRHAPVQIGSGTTWSTVSAGADFTVAMQANGTLWAWGHDNLGQLGDGATSDQHAPVQVGTSHAWTAIATGAIRQSNLALHS